MSRIVLLASALFCLVGCSTGSVTARFQADVEPLQALEWTDPTPGPYREAGALFELFQQLPERPPLLKITQPDPVPPGTPPPAADPYKPLLSFLRAGPGGSVITRAHLVSVTPALLPLAQIAPSMSLSQVLQSPQGWSAQSALQSTFQPLGLWNQTSALYLYNNRRRLLKILDTLSQNLLNPPPPPQGTPGYTPPPVVEVVYLPDPTVELVRVWKRGVWQEIASEAPGLIHAATAHAGFEKPQIVLYGSRKGGYDAGVVMNWEDRVLSLNEEGALMRALEDDPFWQGPDDASLIHLPVEVRRGRVLTLDAVATPRFSFLKEASGGQLDLNRGAPKRHSLLVADLGYEALHARIVAGGGRYFAGGAFLEARIEEDFFSGHLALGLLSESSNATLAYADLEARVRSPKLKIPRPKPGSWAAAWVSTTLSLSALGTQAHGEDRFLQGDVRFVPELHLELGLGPVELKLSLGGTFALVPHGHADLDHPDRSLSLRPIRFHAEGEIRAAPAVAEAVLQVSQLGAKCRLYLGLEFPLPEVFRVGISCHLWAHGHGGHVDAQIGARVAHGPLFVEVLCGEGATLRAGFEVGF